MSPCECAVKITSISDKCSAGCIAVMVSLVKDGDAVASWIHDPLRGITALAERGQGAWMLEADGSRRKLVTPKPPSLAHLSGAPNIRYGDRDFAARIGYRADKLASVMILRCAGQEYIAIAEGQMHFSLYNRALPWDHAAGCLLIEEAGGVPCGWMAAVIGPPTSPGEARLCRPAGPNNGPGYATGYSIPEGLSLFLSNPLILFDIICPFVGA